MLISGSAIAAGVAEVEAGVGVCLSSLGNLRDDLAELERTNFAEVSIEDLNFTNKAAIHMEEPGRFVPVQTLKDAIATGEAWPDPRGTSANMYYTRMMRNGKRYNLEVLYNDVTNTVMHFKYTREAVGPLSAIMK